jgi:putative membrane protein
MSATMVSAQPGGEGIAAVPRACPERGLLWGLTVLALAVSCWRTEDRFTWFLETVPAMLGLALMWATRASFPLTRLLYWLIFVHSLVLILGGTYTYAKVPLGEWAKEWFGWQRNHYDRIGHFMQGFAPAILAREILVRRSPLAGSRWLGRLVFCVCLAFSAFYEMLEWWSALAVGEGADAFLGTQGDPWDTQTDMFLAGVGAIAALLTVTRLHDRQLGLPDAIAPPPSAR